MHNFGQTRSVLRHDHLLQTPDTFVRASLPGMRHATAIVHISRAAGAGFTQYTAELEAGGEVAPAIDQRFVYVLEGEVRVDERALSRADYAYVPPGHDATMVAITRARIAVFEKPYQPLSGIEAPSMFD